MKKYTVYMAKEPKSNQYVHPRIKINVSQEHADKIKAKAEQLKGINYVFLDRAMTDTTIDVCPSNRMTHSEVQDLKHTIEHICAKVTSERRKPMKKYDVEINHNDRRGTICVATEQREAVHAMLDKLPYVDKTYVDNTLKTQIGIYISPLAEPEDLVEMGAKIAEIVNCP